MPRRASNEEAKIERKELRSRIVRQLIVQYACVLIVTIFTVAVGVAAVVGAIEETSYNNSSVAVSVFVCVLCVVMISALGACVINGLFTTIDWLRDSLPPKER